MCDPVTIIGAIGIGLGIAETGISLAGQQSEAEARQKQDKQNAALAQQAASDAMDRGNADAAKTRMQATQMIGQQKVAFANSGVDATSGTPLQVMADTRMMSELDAKTQENNAAREAWGYKQYGLQYQQQASIDAQRAQNQKTATVLGGLGRTTAGVSNLLTRNA